MTAVQVAQRITAEEFLARPESDGLPELWLADTTAEMLVFRRSTPGAAAFDVALELDRAQQLTSPLLPGFALPLAEVFPKR